MVGMQSTACHMLGKGSPTELYPQPIREEWMGQDHRWNHHESQHMCREPGHRGPTPDWGTWSSSQEWGPPRKSHIVEAKYQKVKRRKIRWHLLSKMKLKRGRHIITLCYIRDISSRIFWRHQHQWMLSPWDQLYQWCPWMDYSMDTLNNL